MVLVSTDLLPMVRDFYVDEFDSCLSDVHHPVCLTLTTQPDVADILLMANTPSSDMDTYGRP